MSTTHPTPRRRKHTPEFKQGLAALCQPGVSVSGIALAHGVNANLLRRWIKQYRNELPVPVTSEPSRLVPVQVELPPRPDMDTACSEAIEINLTKNATHINIRWPGNQAQMCAHWLNVWLK